jgi:hypothetical protein
MPNNAIQLTPSLRVRLYGNTAVVTGLTTTKGKFMPDESYE